MMCSEWKKEKLVVFKSRVRVWSIAQLCQSWLSWWNSEREVPKWHWLTASTQKWKTGKELRHSSGCWTNSFFCCCTTLILEWDHTRSCSAYFGINKLRQHCTSRPVCVCVVCVYVCVCFWNVEWRRLFVQLHCLEQYSCCQLSFTLWLRKLAMNKASIYYYAKI